MLNKILMLTATLVSLTAGAQISADSLLRQVEHNNKDIRSGSLYWDTKRKEAGTGLTPADPILSYDYMHGTPAGAGNQRDFSLVQRFDFPTVYARKRSLADQVVLQSYSRQEVLRQQTLLDAKLLYLEIIYLNRRKAELEKRINNMERLLEGIRKKVEQGDAIILDLNKAKLQLLNIKSEAALNQNEKNQLLTRLNAMNGGQAVEINDTSYLSPAVLPAFETVDSLIQSTDPVLKVYDTERQIALRQLAVQQSMRLPSFETGYRSQGILGQRYRGFHAGISIPLWENKNKVRALRANLAYKDAESASQRIRYRMEHRQYYDQLEIRAGLLREYRELLQSLNNTALLNKALSFGQLTVTQYIMEESFYYSALDKYLQTEWEYQSALAKLYRFTL